MIVCNRLKEVKRLFHDWHKNHDNCKIKDHVNIHVSEVYEWNMKFKKKYKGYANYEKFKGRL